MAEQLKILFGYAIHHTNLDQTLLWYAGKQLIHGQIHEPNFYGQRYNTTFESIPGSIFHHFGISLNVAIPLGTTLLAAAIWLILALTAYKKGKRWLALFALALPVIMRVQYLALFDAPRGILAGDFMAVVAVMCAIWWYKDGMIKIASLVALGGVAILWDYSAALIIIPVFVFVLCEEWSQIAHNPKRSLLLGLFSAVPPTTWLLIQRWWYSTHPYDLTAFDVSVIPRWTIFIKNIRHFDIYLSFFSPTIIPTSAVVMMSLIGILTFGAWISLKGRSYKLFMSILSFAILICLTLSLPRATHYYPNLYLSASRLILSLPIAFWLLLLLISLNDEPDQVAKKNKNIRSLLASWILVIVTTASFIVSFRSLDAKLASSNALDVHSGSLVNPTKLLESCARKYNVYKATGAQLFATHDSNLVYGCAAQYYDFNTLEPGYERRGWLINKSYHQPIEKLLISGTSCTSTTKLAGKCSVQDDNLLLIQTPPTNPAITLSTLGLPVKNSPVPIF